MKLYDVKKLTISQVSEIRDFSDDFDILDNYETDQDLSDADFIHGKVVINGIIYHMIHGFPGDEPQGVVYTPSFDEIYCVHWSSDDNNPVTSWYINSLENRQVPKEWFV